MINGQSIGSTVVSKVNLPNGPMNNCREKMGMGYVGTLLATSRLGGCRLHMNKTICSIGLSETRVFAA